MLALLAGCRPVTPPDAAPGAATTGDAAITVSTAESMTIIEVADPRGIGVAQVALPPAGAARPIQVRFPPRRAGAGHLRHWCSAGRSSPSPASRPLPPPRNADRRRRHPPACARRCEWADVALVTGSDAPPVISLPAGYIAITLPVGFIDAGQPLTLRWIYFYR